MRNIQEDPQIHQQGSLELLYALNSVATALQNSIQSEENVYAVFREEVINLGLRGGISLLDERGEVLDFKTVAYSSPLSKVLAGFEKILKVTAKGYAIPVAKVDVYENVTRHGQSIFVPDTAVVSVQVVPQQLKRLIRPLLNLLGNPPGIFVPLIYEGRITGMLNMVGANLTERDVPTMQASANQIAVALENARLVEKLHAANAELETAYQKTLEGWVRALDLRDNETEGHTLRVAQATVELAKCLGVEDADLPHLGRGALLHDIGKMAIPDNILKKPGPLDREEWAIMRQHPQTAYDWLSSIDYLRPALDIPYCHHEHWDGSGYVQGLKGDQIPYWARIFTVVDVWDAMTSDRPYRAALPQEEVYDYIREQSGRLFEPRIVEAFLDLHLDQGRKDRRLS